ncbi:hypothetical protein, partial [Mesomycoplasma ovipneumoniae]|uniref:hypothetical protein n=1 Tax=Mesomycoplasma ovipneumoniae TaxID=29562 RepID=UPI0030800C13
FALVYENKKGKLNSIPVNFLLKQYDTKLDDRKFYSLDESNYNQENQKKYKDKVGIEQQSKPKFIKKQSTILKLKVDQKFNLKSEDNKEKTTEEKAKTPKESKFIRADDNHYFYISGISKEKKKDTRFTIESIVEKLESIKRSTSSLLNEFQFVSLDELGNEYESNEQRKLEEYL